MLSPSTRHIDLMLKRSRYEAAGCPAYWVIDPADHRLIAWELRDGVLEQVAEVVGDTPYVAQLPFPVTITPSQLAAD